MALFDRPSLMPPPDPTRRQLFKRAPAPPGVMDAPNGRPSESLPGRFAKFRSFLGTLKPGAGAPPPGPPLPDTEPLMPSRAGDVDRASSPAISSEPLAPAPPVGRPPIDAGPGPVSAGVGAMSGIGARPDLGGGPGPIEAEAEEKRRLDQKYY